MATSIYVFMHAIRDTLQRLGILQPARTGAKDLSTLLTCCEVLEFATVEGARCTGLEGKVGTLTPLRRPSAKFGDDASRGPNR